MATENIKFPPFGDTATKGSQAENPAPERNNNLSGNSDCPKVNTPEWLKETHKRRRVGKPITRSRLLGDRSIGGTANRSPTKRRTTPFSNWECNPEAPNPRPTEFDLRGFAFAPLPGPRQEYDRFNNDLVIGHYKPSVRPYS